MCIKYVVIITKRAAIVSKRAAIVSKSSVSCIDSQSDYGLLQCPFPLHVQCKVPCVEMDSSTKTSSATTETKTVLTGVAQPASWNLTSCAKTHGDTKIPQTFQD